MTITLKMTVTMDRLCLLWRVLCLIYFAPLVWFAAIVCKGAGLAIRHVVCTNMFFLRSGAMQHSIP